MTPRLGTAAACLTLRQQSGERHRWELPELDHGAALRQALDGIDNGALGAGSGCKASTAR